MVILRLFLGRKCVEPYFKEVLSSIYTEPVSVVELTTSERDTNEQSDTLMGCKVLRLETLFRS